jgi:hypothetical protein
MFVMIMAMPAMIMRSTGILTGLFVEHAENHPSR